MCSNICVRLAKDTDYKSFNQIHSMVNDVNASFAPHILKHSEVTITPELFQEQLLSADVLLGVAEIDDLIVGIVSAEVRKSQPLPALIPRVFIHISHLGVLPAYRKRGIGSALINFCKIWAIQLKISDIEVMVMNSNANAIGFYENCGLSCIKKIYEFRLNVGED